MACVYADGSSEGGGLGLFVGDEVRVDIDGFRITRTASPALYIDLLARMTADHGTVTENVIGLVVADSDAVVFGNDVLLFDNGLDIGHGQLKLPDPPLLIGGLE